MSSTALARDVTYPKDPGVPWRDLGQWTTQKVPSANGGGSYKSIIALVRPAGGEYYGCTSCELAWPSLHQARLHQGAEHPSAATLRRQQERAALKLSASPAQELTPQRQTPPESAEPDDGALFPAEPEPESPTVHGPRVHRQRHGIERERQVELGLDANGDLIIELVGSLVESRRKARGSLALVLAKMKSVRDLLSEAIDIMEDMGE